MQKTPIGFFLVIQRVADIIVILLGNISRKDSGPVYWRKVIEDIGGGFIKLAQILAIRYEILPERYSKEFINLFDRTKPLAKETIEGIFQKYFGKKPEDIFELFSYEACASASFGEVHTAVFNNHKVAVKIQKPGVFIKAQADIAIFTFFAWFLDLFVSVPISLMDAVKEWKMWTIKELDYNLEAQNALRLKIKSSGAGFGFYIPQVFEEVSNSYVLVEEFLDGWTLNGIMHRSALELSQEDKSSICRKLVFGQLLYYFKGGFFHADPHPGNIIIMKNRGLAYIDFGIMGESGTDHQNYCFANFIKFASDDSVAMAVAHFKEFMQGLKLKQDTVNIGDLKYEWYGKTSVQLEKGIIRFVDRKLGNIIKEWSARVVDTRAEISLRSTARYFFSLIGAARRFGMEIPVNLLAFLRSLIIIDMICLVFDPKFNMKEELGAFFLSYPEVCIKPTVISSATATLKNNAVPILNPVSLHSNNLAIREVERELEYERKQRLVERYLEQASRVLERIMEEGSRGLAYFSTTKI